MSNRTTGIVQWFSNDKGYGFIEHKDVDDDVFVHYSELDQEGFKSLEENDRVEFELAETDDGIQAHDVLKIGTEEAMA